MLSAPSVLFVLAGFLSTLPNASAAERHAVIVVGATGGKPYADTYWKWATALRETLCTRLGFAQDHVRLLFEDPPRDPSVTAPSTKAGVTAVAADLRKLVRPGDLVFVFLIGHGSGSGGEARFNLVGPDMTMAEWDALLTSLKAEPLVLVNSASGSANFVEQLSRKGRIVITATDSASQQYETIFPQFFIEALNDAAADQDKNGRVSVWEAFTYAKAHVASWYEANGQLATEHAALDDTGARTPAALDAGVQAKTTYLDAGPAASPTIAESVRPLYERRVALEQQVEELKARKGTLADDEYRTKLEALLLELAKVSRDIKTAEAKPR